MSKAWVKLSSLDLSVLPLGLGKPPERNSITGILRVVSNFPLYLTALQPGHRIADTGRFP